MVIPVHQDGLRKETLNVAQPGFNYCMIHTPRHDALAWFALASLERCRLLHCYYSAKRVHCVKEVETFENSWQEAMNAPPAEDSLEAEFMYPPMSIMDERRERLAAQIVNFLKTESKRRAIDRLTIFARHRIFTLLHSSGELKYGRFQLREGEIMHLTTAGLAVHPAIRGLLANDLDQPEEPVPIEE